MSVLITGSFAYDTIMVFPDQFKNHIIAEKLDILNVCFFVPELRKEFGGCAGNIAYNYHLLGGKAVPMATVGNDFKPYRKWLKKLGIKRKHVRKMKGEYTAQAYLTTDQDANQITAFHPGAMNEAHRNKVSDAKKIKLGIVAPDGKQAMLEHAEQFADAKIPFFFDPGQGLPMFNGDELKRFITLATYVVVNDYESEMLTRTTGLSLQDIAAQVEALIVTRGARGADVYAAGEQTHVDAAPISEAKDPTGCGDAFRAGLLYGVQNNCDWKTTVQIAAVCGAAKIECHGTQNHSYDFNTFEQRYHAAYGEQLNLVKA